MAQFNTVGLEAAQKEFLLMTERATKVVPLALEAGADVLVKAQKEEAQKLNISGRSKGALVRSIKADKVKGNTISKYTEIYPHGVDRSHTKKGVRNAEKGFVLEYGRSNMPARPWMSTANERSASKVMDAMAKVWEETTNGSG